MRDGRRPSFTARVTRRALRRSAFDWPKGRPEARLAGLCAHVLWEYTIIMRLADGAHVLIGSDFEMVLASGERLPVTPESDAGTGGPTRSRVRDLLEGAHLRFTIWTDGHLRIESDAFTTLVTPDPDYEAWEAHDGRTSAMFVALPGGGLARWDQGRLRRRVIGGRMHQRARERRMDVDAVLPA